MLRTHRLLLFVFSCVIISLLSQKNYRILLFYSTRFLVLMIGDRRGYRWRSTGISPFLSACSRPSTQHWPSYHRLTPASAAEGATASAASCSCAKSRDPHHTDAAANAMK